MKKLWFKIASFIIRTFGNIQLFKTPFFCLLWGNTHYKVKGLEVRRVLGLIKPGDIILRRYDRYLSGWLIPGYWTHVGLVVTKNSIIHATTKGVIEEDILSFLRTDHVMVLRCKEEERSKMAVETAYSLLGKEYDFVFDSTDDERMFCSELVKYCYPGVLDDIGTGAIPPDAITKADLEEKHTSAKYRAAEYEEK